MTDPADPELSKTYNIVTSLGDVRLTGRLRGTKPIVLMITGAFADPSEMSRMPLVLADRYDGLVTHLPGNRTPKLKATSIEAFAQAYDEVLTFLSRPAIVVGLSVGALVAMAMRTPNALFLVEPPLDTGKLWPLYPLLDPSLAEHADFLDAVFGLTTDGLTPRRYHHLADRIIVPTTVVWGSEPLYPERAVQRLPSLADTPDRAYLERNTHVTAHVLPNTGHNVPVQAGRLMVELLLDAAAQITVSRRS